MDCLNFGRVTQDIHKNLHELKQKATSVIPIVSSSLAIDPTNLGILNTWYLFLFESIQQCIQEGNKEPTCSRHGLPELYSFVRLESIPNFSNSYNYRWCNYCLRDYLNNFTICHLFQKASKPLFSQRPTKRKVRKKQRTQWMVSSIDQIFAQECPQFHENFEVSHNRLG